jgi:hypothetical protein
MRFSGVWLALLLASLVPAPAQVTVEVTQDQEQFIPGEPLTVAVRITNRSGQDLHLGAEEDWLIFGVESREGLVVSKIGDAPVTGEFVLEPSHVAIKRADIAPYFSFPQAGRYKLTATLRIKEWGRDITSPPKNFDIIEGTRLWDQEVGIPKSPDSTNSLPELRHYVLQQANYIKGQIRLYLRVTDGYGKTVKVTTVGPMVSFSRPEAQLDQRSRLHLLYQNGLYGFNYTVYNTDGDLITRQTYDYVDKRPRLRIDDTGNILVFGGIRRLVPTDIPPPTKEELAAQEAALVAPTAGSTNNPSGTNSLPADKSSKKKKQKSPDQAQ